MTVSERCTALSCEWNAGGRCMLDEMDDENYSGGMPDAMPPYWAVAGCATLREVER